MSNAPTGRPRASWKRRHRGLKSVVVLMLVFCGSADVGSTPAHVTLDRCMIGESTVVIGFTITKPDGTKMNGSELRASQYRTFIVVNGQTTEGTLEKDQFKLPLTLPRGPAKATVRIDTSDSGRLEQGTPTTIDVLPTIELRPPAAVEFGEVPAGCEPDAHCRRLDLSESLGLWEGAEIVVGRPVVGGESSDAIEVRIRSAGVAEELSSEGEVKTKWSPASGIEICVKPRECTTPPTKPFALTVRVAHPCVAALRESYCKHRPECPTAVFGMAPVLISAQWQPKGWWYCNRLWVFGLALALLLGILLYGFLSPNRFHRNATLRVASQHGQLKRASAKQLRSCPGGRPGLFRHATVCLNAEGFTVKPQRGALLRLKAGSASAVEISGSSQLERWERGRFRPVEGDAKRTGRSAAISVQFNTAYRIGGSLYFEVLL